MKYNKLKASGRRVLVAIMCCCLFGNPILAYGNPLDGQVVSGDASINSNGQTTTITQNSDRAIIDWRGFDIEADEHTEFVQPSSSAVALNRVRSNSPSQINGRLTANGKVIIVNQNGIFFGGGSVVDVSGLVATSADIRNEDFNSGNLKFDISGNKNAKIINEGSITANNAGLIGFIAPQVENRGIINARLGKVQLAAGDKFVMDLAGDQLTQIAVSDEVTAQLASNSGHIMADGGEVYITAPAARNAIDSLIKNTGFIEAKSIGNKNGKIILMGAKDSGSKVIVGGKLDASGKNGSEKGGKVEILGDDIKVLSDSKIDASGKTGGGNIKIGGDYLGSGTTQTANNTIIESGAEIYANAIDEGNGGNVIVWSDVRTDFLGYIDASGGANSGNGGFVETSGKQILNMTGNVNASASNGNSGTWLMDPYSVTITSSTSNISSSGTNPITYTPSGTSNLLASSIVAALDAGTNVIVTTGGAGSAGADVGDITVSSAITSTGSGSLTLQAYRNITVSSAINLAGGALTLQSNYADLNSGYINVAAAISTNGGNITMGGGSGTISAGSGYAYGNSGQATGILINNVAVDAAGGNVIINARGFDTSGNSNHGLRITGATGEVKTVGNGSVTVNAIGGGNTNSASNYGTILDAGAKITTVDGNILINSLGGGAGSGGSNYGFATSSTNTTVKTTGNGSITINATGGNASGSGASNFGFYVANTNAVQTTGGGAINITGTGGNGTGGSGTLNYGVYVSGGSVVGSGGAMIITGVGGNSSNSNNHGVGVASSGVISNTGSGTITLTGTGRGNTNSGGDYGVYLQSGGVISVENGSLDITATGGGTGTGNSNMGLYVTGSNSTVKSEGSGNITINATGGNASGSGGSNYGVYITNANGIQTTSTGGITINTTGGNGSGSGTNNHGIYLTAANAIKAHSTGNISITGTGGASTGATNIGVNLSSASIVASGGNINITGLSKSGGATSGANGVFLTTSSVTNSGAGNITITGTGGNGTGGTNRGVYLISGSTVSTGTGTIDITGTGGAGAGTNHGISISTSGVNNISTSGAGNIILRGYANGSSGSNIGIKSSTTSSSITSAGGNITLIGYGGAASTSNLNYGIEWQSNISTSGSGTITLTGVGGGASNSGTNYGLYFFNGGNANTVNGQLTATGTGGGAGTGTSNNGIYITGTNSTLKTTGSGNLIINAINGGGATASNHGLNLAVANALRTTNTGSITVKADKLSLGLANNINSAADLVLQPYTSQAGGIGSGGTWTITDAQLGYATWGASNTLYLGGRTNADATATSLDINTAYSFSKPVSFVNATGSDITVAGQISNSYNGTAVTIASGRNFINNVGSTAINLTGGASKKWLVYSTNPASDTINSLSADYRRFSCSFDGSCPTLGTGNGFLYSYTPNLTITPDAASATYGDATPSFAYTISGYLGSDSASDSITGAPSYVTAYSQGSNAGSYDITSSANNLASSMGYGFTYATRSNGLTIAKKSVTASWVAALSKTYGDSNPSVDYNNFNFTGLYGADSGSLFSSITPNFGAVTASSNAGTYTNAVSATIADTTNYTVSNSPTTSITINPAALTVTAAAKTKTYGDSDPSLTYSYSGLVNGDTSSVFSGVLSRTSGENAGTYSIGQNTLSAGGNYSISFTGSNLTINPATLTVTAAAKTKTYGDSDPSLTYSYSGLVNGDTSSVFSGALSRTSGENAGTYSIGQNTLSAGGNYSISFTGSNLTINPATLTVTVDNKERGYGQANPSFTYSISGFKNSETESLVSGLSLASSANNTSAGGTYAITASGASASNYLFSYIDGLLTVRQLILPVTVETLGSVVIPEQTGKQDSLIIASPSNDNNNSSLGNLSSGPIAQGFHALLDNSDLIVIKTSILTNYFPIEMLDAYEPSANRRKEEI